MTTELLMDLEVWAEQRPLRALLLRAATAAGIRVTDGPSGALCVAVLANPALGAAASSPGLDRGAIGRRLDTMADRRTGRIVLVTDIGPGARQSDAITPRSAEDLLWWKGFTIRAARRGIQCNTIRIGFSPEAGHELSPLSVNHLLRYQPLRREVVASDVAGPLRFLLSAGSAYLVGEVLEVDGGAHLGYFPALHGDGRPKPARASTSPGGVPGRIDGMTALVTGASSGIGRACALDLARRGAGVVLTARRLTQLDDVAHEIEHLGQRAWTLRCDLSDPDAACDLPERAWKATGAPIERLLGAAGQLGLASPDGEDVRLSTLQVNFLSAATVTERMTTRWVTQGIAGAALSVSSVSSTLAPVALLENYGPSKAALTQHLRALAVSVGKYGIRTNSIRPGIIDTDMGGTAEDPHRRGWLSRIPLGRIGRPDEVAAVASYLLARGSEMSTGSAPRVDGGFGLGWIATAQEVMRNDGMAL